VLLTHHLHSQLRIKLLRSSPLSGPRLLYKQLQLIINFVCKVNLILRLAHNTTFPLDPIDFNFIELHLSLVLPSGIGPQLDYYFPVAFVENFHLLRPVEKVLGVFGDIGWQLGKVNEVLMNVVFHMPEGVPLVVLLQHVFVDFQHHFDLLVLALGHASLLEHVERDMVYLLIKVVPLLLIRPSDLLQSQEPSELLQNDKTDRHVRLDVLAEVFQRGLVSHIQVHEVLAHQFGKGNRDVVRVLKGALQTLFLSFEAFSFHLDNNLLVGLGVIEHTIARQDLHVLVDVREHLQVVDVILVAQHV
jgi:hypothetical protein